MVAGDPFKGASIVSVCVKENGYEYEYIHTVFIYLFSQTKYMIWVLVDPKMANLFSMTQSQWNILYCFGFIFVYVYNLHLDSQAMCRAKCKGSTSFRPQCSVLAEVNCSFSHFNDLTDTALHTQVGLCYFVSSVY